MPLNLILRKCTNGYKFSKSQEKINHIMYTNDIKLFPKNEKKNGNSNTVSDIVQSRHRDGITIEKCARLIMKNGKRHMSERKE